jgi:hypothetical protein
VETDIRYYRRRACEEMSAASRAVTPEARERRLQLVGRYLDHLKALNAPSPFDEQQFAGMLDNRGGKSPSRAAFDWAGAERKSGRA